MEIFYKFLCLVLFTCLDSIDAGVLKPLMEDDSDDEVKLYNRLESDISIKCPFENPVILQSGQYVTISPVSLETQKQCKVWWQNGYQMVDISFGSRQRLSVCGQDTSIFIVNSDSDCSSEMKSLRRVKRYQKFPVRTPIFLQQKS